MPKKIKESIIALKYPNITSTPGGKVSKSQYITPSLFEQHLLWLMSWRYNPLASEELMGFFFQELDIPYKSFLLIFEGGYKNIKLNAYPILKRYKIPALIFLVVNYIGDLNRWEDSKEAILSIEDITELNSNTMVSFGLQSKSHKDLTKLSDEELNDEIISSKYLLEEMLRYKVNYFNYPYNKYNINVIRKLAEAEIPLAFINKTKQITSLESFYTIPSIKLSEKDGYWSLLSKLRQVEN